MRRVRKTIILVMALIALALAAAGCGSEESSQAQGDSQGGSNRDDMQIAFVTHGDASDPWFSVLVNGINQAADDMGVKVNYSATETFDMVQMAQLVEGAIAKNPDGLVVSMPDPDALDKPLREAKEAGIPVIVTNALGNASAEYVENHGILMRVGQNEYEAGRAAGERLKEAGANNALCVNHVVGHETMEQRCRGFMDGFGGEVRVIGVDSTNTADTQGKIEAALRDESINGMLLLGPPTAESGLAAVEASGRADQISVGNFDLSPVILEAVNDGRLVFAVDQQQYLQGYLPVVFLAQYARTGTIPPSNMPTGPNIINQGDAQSVIDFSEEGLR